MKTQSQFVKAVVISRLIKNYNEKLHEKQTERNHYTDRSAL